MSAYVEKSMDFLWKIGNFWIAKTIWCYLEKLSAQAICVISGLSLKNWESSPGILFNAPFLELVCICGDADIF